MRALLPGTATLVVIGLVCLACSNKANDAPDQEVASDDSHTADLYLEVTRSDLAEDPQVTDVGSEEEQSLPDAQDTNCPGVECLEQCCEAGSVCADGACCTPNCGGRTCGDDGCGGSCGECGEGQDCVEGAECKELGLKWIAIPGGTFQMGCSPDDDMCNQDELPVHQVTLGGFAMLETEVTEAQYEPILGVSPPCPYGFGVTGPNTPVECVTWFDAADFCEAVGGRLPTEAEWEYAARGGKATRYSCGDDPTCLDSTAWFEDNSGDMIQPVKGKEPNDYGLYDMIGNVWEWNSDWYSADYYSVSPDANPSGPDSGEIRSARGGSATTAEVKFLRVSFRHPAGPTAPVSGFRCVR